MQRKSLCFLIIFSGFSFGIFGQTSKFHLDSKDIVQLMHQEKVPALAIGIIKENRLQETRVFGRLDSLRPANSNSIFNVASLTKPILTMLCLKLVETGNWDLDEPLYHFWTDPDVREHRFSKILTSRHILTHQSGFSNWRWENENKKLQFHYQPGKGFGYSGEGFEYLQKAIENRFHSPLAELADSLLFKPLGMKTTYFFWNQQVQEENFAKWHDEKGRQVYKLVKNTTASAADDLLTTIGDYSRFAEYVLKKVEEDNWVYRQMISRGNGIENATVMGLGWEILPALKGNEYALLHTGGDHGVRTLVLLLPETGEGLVIFTNADNGNSLFFPLIEKYLSLGRQITGADNS